MANLAPTHTQQAIDAAEAALPAWRSLTHKQRSRLLRKSVDLIMAHRDDLARLMTAEQGKPLAEATGEVVYGATFVEWYAEEAKRTYGETVPSSPPTAAPWCCANPSACAQRYALELPRGHDHAQSGPGHRGGLHRGGETRRIHPAVRPGPGRAGAPRRYTAGVINVVPTQHAAAVQSQVLCDSPVVRHLSFTGSTEVGRILMAQCAPTIKKLALELGGNAPSSSLTMPIWTAPSKGPSTADPRTPARPRLRQPPVRASGCVRCLCRQAGRARAGPEGGQRL